MKGKTTPELERYITEARKAKTHSRAETESTPRTPGLEERLQNMADASTNGLQEPERTLLREAADEIARLTAELEDQRERTRTAAGDAWDFGEMAREFRAERDALREALRSVLDHPGCEDFYCGACGCDGDVRDTARRALNSEGGDRD